MHQKELTTKLVIDLASLNGFGNHEQNNAPFDISPFSFLVLSDYSHAWDGFRNIITLPPSTTLRWELDPLGYARGKMVVSNITVTFKLIGCPLQGESLLQEWEKIFSCENASFDPVKGTLQITATGFPLTKHHVLSASITTVADLKPTYNLTYSLYMDFTDSLGDIKQVYFLKIDPLIKNNSNPPPPIP